MTKEEVIAQLVEKLDHQVAVMRSALADSNESATGDETKSEGKYDTRAIEAAYLAEAQAEQLAIAEESLLKFKRFNPPAFDISDEIAVGALIEVEQDGEIAFYLLAPTGGGLTTEFLGCELTVITPEARLFEDFLEMKLGSRIEEPPMVVMGLE